MKHSRSVDLMLQCLIPRLSDTDPDDTNLISSISDDEDDTLIDAN